MWRFLSASWARGFKTLFKDVKKGIEIIVESKEFSSDDTGPLVTEIIIRKSALHIFFILAPLFLFFHCLFFWRGQILFDITSLIVLGVFVYSLAVLVAILRATDLATKQWHSCEHKFIRLLSRIVRRGFINDLTIDNLERQSRVHWGCDTTIKVFFRVALFGLYVINVIVPIKFLEIPYGFYLYFGIAKSIAGAILFIPVLFIISFLIQFFFRTAKPTQEQLEETLRVGEEFLKKYQEFTNGSLK